jgi:hypothetical protein
MNCAECKRLLAELDHREEMYFDALGHARTDAERENPSHYSGLHKAVQEARLGLDIVVEDLQQHRSSHGCELAAH